MKKTQEALELSSQILDSIELNEGNIQALILKALRVCRLINDEKGIRIFTFEACGYERDSNGKLTDDAKSIMAMIGRDYYKKEKEVVKCIEPRLIGELVDEKNALIERMKVASDPQNYGDNMTPYMINLAKNTQEREQITRRINHNNNFINAIRGFLYKYILNIYTALNYGNITESIFESVRDKVDFKIASFCPTNIKRFLSVYENLTSENSEDWANAVHSCRRIIIELSNKLYPSKEADVKNNAGKLIKVKEENYVNRLMLYIESKSTSKTFANIIGSELGYIGQVLDSITDGLNKGTHSTYSRDEAKRVVVYTYLLIGDILNL